MAATSRIQEILADGACDVHANSLVALWMREKARRDPATFCRLAGDNGRRFAALWGPGEKASWNGRPAKAWLASQSGAPILALSTEQGTVFVLGISGEAGAADFFATDRARGSAITAVLEGLCSKLAGG